MLMEYEASAVETQSRNGQPAEDISARTLYLTGRPTLKQYLRWARRNALTPPPEGDLVDQWEAARQIVQQIEKDERGIADHPPMGKLGPEYEPLLIEFLNDPLVRNGFNTVPTDVAMVELDTLVVYQKHIDVTFADQWKTKLGPSPSRESLFQVCLPYDHPHPPVKWSRIDSESCTFLSPSNDLRYLGMMRMEPDNITNYPPPGALVGVVAAAIGFGSNFLNAIYVENRLILNNGSHRAYALRKMGITHVPCIVQHVPSRDALEVVAPYEVRTKPDLFLKHPRPAMLKDYLDPRIHTVLPVHRRLRQITVRLEVEEVEVPAM
jgi:plasmid stabilization system protein ParE